MRPLRFARIQDRQYLRPTPWGKGRGTETAGLRAKKWTSLPRYCRECEVLSMCNGGCPKDRVIKTPDGEEGLNYLCAGLKQFFTHSKPYFRRFAELADAGEPAEKLM